MSDTHAMDIVHDAHDQVFYTTVDGERCVLEYSRQGKVITITHTGVPKAVPPSPIRIATEAVTDRPDCVGAPTVPVTHPASTIAHIAVAPPHRVISRSMLMSRGLGALRSPQARCAGRARCLRTSPSRPSWRL